MESILISAKDFNEARKKIRSIKGKKIIFFSNDDELNRKVLEKEPIDILLLNQKGRKDKAKQRDSGFNQVLAKIALKKKVVIGINLEEVINSSTKEKAEILGRIRQNIKICKKNKLNMVFISIKGKDQYDIKSLGLSIGMPTWMTKKL